MSGVVFSALVLSAAAAVLADGRQTDASQNKRITKMDTGERRLTSGVEWCG